MEAQVRKIINNSDLQEAFAIRREVFVVEQAVDPAEEYEFEEESVHFLASYDGAYAGTARWRKTANGVKLERFAVREAFRSKGIGSALLKSIIADIPASEPYLYLHAQITAMGLYSKFGFAAVGDEFIEADIRHYKMELRR